MDKYKTKKEKSQAILKYIVMHVSANTVESIARCGEFLAFMANFDLSKLKLHSANSCNNRFCPLCAWRRAKKDALKISVCMRYVKKEYDKEFIFASFTAPNVPGNMLVKEIDKFNKALRKTVERKDVQAVNKGYIRKLEITYNKKTNTYHPHFHVIMAVNKSYFTSRDYINQNKWLELWREAMDDDSITQVDVRKVKNDSKDMLEMAKYAAKDSDMTVSQEVFDTFYTALKGRQVITYNGLFKQAVDMYKKGELDSYKDVDETEYVYFLLYRWGKGEYVEAEKRELTEDERKKLNKQLVEESEVD